MAKREDLKAIETKIADMEARILKWFVTVAVTAAVALLAAILRTFL